MTLGRDEPVYAIGVVVKMVRLHAQTLRNYERWGLIKPVRPSGRVRLYSQRDVERITQIKSWMDDLGVNVAGVEVMMKLRERIAELEGQVTQITIELVRLRDGGPRSLPGRAQPSRQAAGPTGRAGIRRPRPRR